MPPNTRSSQPAASELFVRHLANPPPAAELCRWTAGINACSHRGAALVLYYASVSPGSYRPEREDMRIEDLRKNFPANVDMPSALLRLLEYQHSVNHFYSGSFELYHQRAMSVLYWFDKDEEAASQFAIFGHGGDGSLYGYWLYNGRTIGNVPIVFLGSEAEAGARLSSTDST
jgi:hypothetical protein